MDGYAALGGILVFMTVFLIAIIVLSIIANWKIFTKAGRPGWHSIIPGLSQYTLFDLASGKGWIGIIYFIVSVVSASATYSASDSVNIIVSFCSIAVFGIGIYLAITLGRAFGKGTGFMVGLIFLSTIFMMILGLGQSVYIGPNGQRNVNDPYGDIPPGQPYGGATQQGPYGYTQGGQQQGTSYGSGPYGNQNQAQPQDTAYGAFGDPYGNQGGAQNNPYGGQTGAQNNSYGGQTGAPGAPQMQARFCPNCGAPAGDARFCGNCGKELA